MDRFDAVILAMPPRDAESIGGSARALIKRLDALRQVSWRSRFALSVWWAPSQRVAASRFVNAVTVAHKESMQSPTAKDADADVLDAVVIQSADGELSERERANLSPVLTIQASEAFWRFRSRDEAGSGGRAETQRLLLRAVRDLEPRVNMPPPSQTKIINWRTSQVLTPSRAPGVALIASSSPPLILTGDWATESSFDGCVAAAIAAVDLLLRAVPQGDGSEVTGSPGTLPRGVQAGAGAKVEAGAGSRGVQAGAEAKVEAGAGSVSAGRAAEPPRREAVGLPPRVVRVAPGTPRNRARGGRGRGTHERSLRGDHTQMS